MAAMEVKLEFDLRVHGLSAIKKAAYRFTDQCAADIRQTDAEHVSVTLTPRSTTAIDALAFQNEVLDQDLRDLIAEETKPIRNLLLAQAFCEFSSVDPAGDSADFHDDPLNIAAEAHGKLDDEDIARP